MSYEIIASIISILFGIALIIFNKKMAHVQKSGAEGKTDIVSRRMNKYSFRDVRLLSAFVGVVFILFGVIGVLQA